MMPVVTIVTGALLVAVGVWGYVGSTAASPETALIPAGLGIVLVFLGLMAFKEGVRKHVMHGAAMLALLGSIGAIIALSLAFNKGKDLSERGPQAQSLMAVLCLTLLGLCVNSFIQVRRARRRAEQSGAPPV